MSIESQGVRNLLLAIGGLVALLAAVIGGTLLLRRYPELIFRTPKHDTMPTELEYVLSYRTVALFDEHVARSKRMKEPSGICFHPGRGTLFVVSDQGWLYEVATDGRNPQDPEVSYLRAVKLLRKGLRGNLGLTQYKGLTDYEAITCDPATGLLYIGVEDDEVLLEVDPETLQIREEFPIIRTLPDGRKLRGYDNQGLEGLCFIPDVQKSQYLTFLFANQSYTFDWLENPSAVFRLQLSRSESPPRPAYIIGEPIQAGLLDLSALHYDAAAQVVYVVGNAHDIVAQVAWPSGELLRWCRLPGEYQEGLTMDDDGYWYIAQDQGGVLKIEVWE